MNPNDITDRLEVHGLLAVVNARLVGLGKLSAALIKQAVAEKLLAQVTAQGRGVLPPRPEKRSEKLVPTIISLGG